jgi:hypothetical protein
MNSSLISFAEYMQDYRTTELSPRRVQNSVCQLQYSCPQLRHRVPEVRILLSGNGMFRSMKAVLRSEKESFRSFFAISNEKTGVIPVRNWNVAMKNWNVAIDNGNVEVGDRNVVAMEEKFHSPLIKRGMKNTEFDTLYVSRANAKEARRKSGTLTELAAKANTSFDIICQIVNGLSLMSLDAETKAVIDEVIGFINGQIYLYTVVYRRHVGVIASSPVVMKGEMSNLGVIWCRGLQKDCLKNVL